MDPSDESDELDEDSAALTSLGLDPDALRQGFLDSAVRENFRSKVVWPDRTC
jgi:hypothetical protein